MFIFVFMIAAMSELEKDILNNTDSLEINIECNGKETTQSKKTTKHKLNKNSKNKNKVNFSSVFTDIEEKIQNHLLGIKKLKTDKKRKKYISGEKKCSTLRTFSKRSLKCEICGKSYSSGFSLRRHIRIIHLNIKAFVCEHCGRGFYEKSNLVTHKRVHTGEKPYQCDVCAKRFSQSNTLITHKRIHSGERPFQCDQCGRYFISIGNLSIHLKAHANKKGRINQNVKKRELEEDGIVDQSKFQCKLCGRRFKQLNSLKRHEKTHSELESKLFQCSFCNRVFKQLGYLDRHEKKHANGEIYQCTICNKTVSNQVHLQMHMKSHSLNSSKGENYSTDNKEIIDKTDDKTCSPDHNIIQDFKESFQCRTCNETFLEESTLIEHRQLHISINTEDSSKIISSDLDISDDNWNSDHSSHSENEIEEKLTENNINTESVASVDVNKDQCQQKNKPIENCLYFKSKLDFSSSDEEVLTKFIVKSKNEEEIKLNENKNSTKFKNFVELSCDKIIRGNHRKKSSIKKKKDVLNNKNERNQRKSIINKTSSENKLNFEYSLETIKSEEEFHSALKKDKPSKTVECDICHKLFISIANLGFHKINKHGVEKPHRCEECNENFTSWRELKKHKKIHGDQQPYVCKFCNKRFSKQCRLKVHMVIHTGEKRYKCSVCSKEFAHWTSFKNHKFMHMNSPNIELEKIDVSVSLQCHECGKLFPNQYFLNRHKKIHSGEKPFQCETCGRKFAEQWNLRTHVRTVHTLEKPFQCDLCEKTFVHSNIMRRHRESHLREPKQQIMKRVKMNKSSRIQTSDIPIQVKKSQIKFHKDWSKRDPNRPPKIWKCNICDKICPRRSALIVHKETHQKIKQPKQLKCDVCNKVFSKPFLLTRHKVIHSDQKPYLCNTCGKGFSYQNNLRTHLRVHTGERPYKCDVCFKTFRQVNSLTTHKRIHTGEKPFSCKICNKYFSDYANLERHHRTHTGEKAYKCNLCNQGFSTRKVLQSHVANHTGEKAISSEECYQSFTARAREIRTGEKSLKEFSDAYEKAFYHNLVSVSDGNVNSDYNRMIHNSSTIDNKFISNQNITDNQNNISVNVKYDSNNINSAISQFDFSTTQLVGSNCPSSNDNFSNTFQMIEENNATKLHSNVSNLNGINQNETIPKEKLKKHECEICGKIFEGKLSKLKRHMKIHTGEKPFQCDVCGRDFTEKSALRTHVTRHFSYDCDSDYELNKKQDDGSELEVCNQKDNDNDEYITIQCDICKKYFSSFYQLNRHKIVHSGVKPFRCDMCGKNFSQKHNLRIHMRTHTGEKPYQCDICFKRFSQTSILKRHKEIHASNQKVSANEILEDNTKIVTEKCVKKDTTSSKNIVNSNPEPDDEYFDNDNSDFQNNDITCEEQEEGNTVEKNKTQITSSFDEDNFNYTDLNESDVKENFNLVDNKLNNEPTEHESNTQINILEDENVNITETLTGTDCSKKVNIVTSDQISSNRYHCEFCGETFRTPFPLRYHRISKHPDQKLFNCALCKIGFNTPDALKQHKKTHAMKCTFCDKSFSHFSIFRNHLQGHTGEKLYQCSFCGKRFTSSSYIILHTRIHTGYKPFQCKDCGKSFTAKKYLKNHENVHLGDKTHQCQICFKRFTQSSSLHIHKLSHSTIKPFECKICSKTFAKMCILNKHIKRGHKLPS